MIKIFNCLACMRQQIRLRSIKFLVLSVLSLWLIGFPGIVSAQVVDIPDPGLRTAIAEALNKAPGETITRAEMETLTKLLARSKDITDLRGIEFAINLTELYLSDNTISDISPLSSLTNLTELVLKNNTISDISALSSLTNLTELGLNDNTISDISPLSGLTNLTWLVLSSNTISDISPLSSLTNLTWLVLSSNTISDISALSSLTNLTELELYNNTISDISPLSSLTNLTWLDLENNTISDISPLSSLTNLTSLVLENNTISDISPLSSLTNLTSLVLKNNTISDISPLSSLTNLTWLDLKNNQIRDVFPLIGLINLEELWLAGNPIEDLSPLEALVAQNPGVDVDILRPPKITGPWLWMIAPTELGQGGAASIDVDSLAVASGGTVTETDVATNGAAIGDRVGNYAWTPAEISADTGDINEVVNTIGFAQGDVDDHSSYALINFTSATALSGVRMYVGSDDSIKVWLNGQVVHTTPIESPIVDWGASDFQDLFQVDLVAGNNLLLVKVSERAEAWRMFVGIDAEVTVLPPGEPGEPIDPPLDINGDGQVNVIDLMWVAISYGMRGGGLPADVNADGIVNVQDFAAVAAGVDAANPLPQGMKQVLLAALEQAIEVEGVAEAPTGFRTLQHDLSKDLVYDNVAAALADARLLAETGNARLRKGITLLETLLELLTEMRAIPETTALLPNYPNPFNPETWIPYHLANASDVRITIFDARGSVVRQLDLGNQQEGYYTSKVRAAYWDGTNDLGESVASGVYFYQLQADNTSILRKMLILK